MQAMLRFPAQAICALLLFLSGTATIVSNVPAQVLGSVEKDAIGKGETNSSGVKNGPWIFTRPDGSQWASGKYIAGKRTGKWRVWHVDGWVEREVEFNQDPMGGYYTQWRYDTATKQRTKVREGEFVDLMREGLGLEYTADGRLRSKGIYKNGQASGLFEFFDSSGRLMSKGPVRNGSYEGEYQLYGYHPLTGASYLSSKGVYKDSLAEGEWTSFFPDGTKESSGKYDKGMRTGMWTLYHANGKVARRGPYENNEWTGTWKIYTPDGWLESVGAGTETRREGLWQVYQMSPEGKHVKLSSGSYVENYETGPWVFYHPNGEVMQKGEYVLGLQHGVFEKFEDNGQLSSRTEYDHGRINGTEETWYANGKPKRVSQYVRGKQHGDATVYHLNGKTASEGRYKKGTREGAWRFWLLDGTLDKRRTGKYREHELVKLADVSTIDLHRHLGLVPQPAPIALSVALRMPQEFVKTEVEMMLEEANQSISEAPHDHHGYTQAYLIHCAVNRAVSEQTRSIATRAIKALQDHPMQLVRFIDKALLTGATQEEFTMALVALTPVIAAGRRVARIRIAHLRTLDGLGQTRAAIQQNRSILEDIDYNVDDISDLALAISRLKLGSPFAQIGLRAVEMLLDLDNRRPLLQELRFRFLNDFAFDARAAEKVASSILEKIGVEQINNWTWNLMTEPETVGQFDSLALWAAERMIRYGRVESFEYDTIALAMILGGRTDEGIEYARKALAAEPNNREYRTRLDSYLSLREKLKQEKRTQDRQDLEVREGKGAGK